MITIGGREYAPEFMYRQTDVESVFTRVAPLIIPMPQFQSKNIAQLPFNATTESGSSLRHAKLSHTYNNLTMVKSNVSSPVAQCYTDNGTIVAKFCGPQFITDIGIIGRIPRVTTITKRSQVNNRRRHKKISGGHLYLMNDVEHANIMAFMLYYRNVDTKKWVKVGSFVGTSSMITENVINLLQHFNVPQGIYTDSLKFVAKNKEELYMRVAVYGIATPTDQKIGTCDTVTYCIEKDSRVGQIFDKLHMQLHYVSSLQNTTIF